MKTEKVLLVHNRKLFFISPKMGVNRVSTEFFTPDELVDRYRGKVTKRTLANWRSKGEDGKPKEGPNYTKIGGRVLYPIKDVLDWEQKRKRAA